MSQGRWTSTLHIRGAALLLAGGAAVALTAGCGNTTSGFEQPEGSASPSTTSSSAPKTSAGTAQGDQLTVSDAVGQQLCDIIEPQLSDWRVQGPTLGKISLNGSVHEWALRNGAINGQVLGDKDSVDRIMTAQCPDVHAQAVSALELPSLAAGLL
ncbi:MULTISPECIES: hypothetical protein [unclassified Nocardia]|uniref:hypothetical protein n=1 Tax=unclassified Nocardia TaxID=2637762 RepID=UPI0024A9CD78|nr:MULTISPECIES: hypothetical protein [unclassified Nocardia]